MATTISRTEAGTRPRSRRAKSGTAPELPPTPAYEPGILRALGIVGLDAIEPVILAALATEAPLLLVGPHGTGKSLLLARLCEALGLKWRHYNSSLLNYDDLVGYPLPDADGRLRFIETPASIWGAEAVFLDEISRCRPDMQNRLFPIVHERRVQGLPLPALRFRWAAMNPPGNPDSVDDDPYAGSVPLDDALADRFPFIVRLPSFAELGREDREAVIRQRLDPVDPAAAQSLRDGVAAVRARIPVVEAACGALFAAYVDGFASLVVQAGWAPSGRRATMLFGNLVSVVAAAGPGGGTGAMAVTWTALRASIPTVATGRVKVDEAKLRAIHQEAWTQSGMDAADPRRALLSEADPTRRALLALALPVGRQVRSTCVADALAALPAGARHAFALHLAHMDGPDLYPAVAEEVANLVGEITVPRVTNIKLPPSDARHAGARRIKTVLQNKDGVHLDAHREAFLGLLPNLFSKGVLVTEASVDACTDQWIATCAQLQAPSSRQPMTTRARQAGLAGEGAGDGHAA